MRCEQAMELLSAKLDGELDPQTDAALTRHLETCEACRCLWTAYCEIDAGIADLEAEPPAELYTGVMEKIRTTPVVKPVKKRRPMWGIGTLVAAAAVFALMISTGTVQLPTMETAGNASGAVAEEMAITTDSQDALAYDGDMEEAAPEAPAEAAVAEAAQSVETVETEQILPAGEQSGVMAASLEPFELDNWLSRQSVPVVVAEVTLAEAEQLLQEWEALDWLEVPSDLAQWQSVADGVWCCEIDTALLETAVELSGGTLYESAEESDQALLLLICGE